MRRTCARPGCTEVATTTLSYDYATRCVWLEALAEEPHPMVHDLCTRHADTLSVPRGWLLRDERPTVTDLFPASEPATPSDTLGVVPARAASA